MDINLKYDHITSIPFNIVDGTIYDSCGECVEDVFEGQIFDQQHNVSYNFVIENGRFRTFVYIPKSFSKFVIQIQDIETEFQIEFQPEPTRELSVKCIYLMCKNDASSETVFEAGTFECPFWMNRSKESASKRLSIGLAMIQCFLLKTIGKTFHIELNTETNLPKVYDYILKETPEYLWKLSSQDLWRRVGNSLMNSDHSTPNTKFAVFSSFSRYRPDLTKPLWDATSQISGYASHGGSGLALLSTHCLYAWPCDIELIIDCLNDQSPVNTEDFFDDSSHRGTLSGCYSTTLGAAIHELCHTFSLGHSNTGIMGQHFHNIDHFFLRPSSPNSEPWFTESQAQILLHHPWLQKEYFHGKSLKTYKYLISKEMLISEYPIKVIETRKLGDERILDWKIFKNCRTKIHSLKSQICEASHSEGFNLFAIDDKGNIFEATINRNKR